MNPTCSSLNAWCGWNASRRMTCGSPTPRSATSMLPLDHELDIGSLDELLLGQPPIKVPEPKDDI